MRTTTDKSSTVGASSPPDRLTGLTVRLWPYAPGVYGRDCLYRVWRLIEEEGCALRCFWDQGMVPATGGDLASFIRAFDQAPNRVLLMVEALEPSHLVGCCWFTEIQIGHQAFGSIFMVKAARGPMSVEASRLAIRYIFEQAQLEQLWGLTPWREAAVLCRRLGFEHLATLPRFARVGDQSYPVHVLRLTKEAWDGQELSIQTTASS